MECGKQPGKLHMLLTGEWRLRLIIALGLVGMGLILFSQFFSFDSGGEPEDTATAEFVSEQYIADLEQKLGTLIAGVEGAGKTRVMVTLESGVEYVYAQEEKRNTDLSREGETETSAVRMSEQENVEQTYIFMEQDGQQQPLLRTELQPKIQGVVVICEGADDAQVQARLTDIVTTALQVSSTQVCVVKYDSSSTE